MSNFEKRSDNTIMKKEKSLTLQRKYRIPPGQSEPAKKPLTFIDLFAGIGGIRIAMEKNGFECAFSSEWDRFASLTYEANFGEKPAGNIQEINASSLPDFDILCGGFPCQPFSIAGVSKKNALGRDHGFLDLTQGTLFFDILRIIKAKKPQAFLLENVKNLQSHDGGRTFAVIQSSLEKLGYRLHFEILNSRTVLPQNRARIFIVGFLDPFSHAAFRFPESLKNKNPRCDHPGIATILEPGVADKYTLSDKLWKYLQMYKEKHRLQGHGFGFGLTGPDEIARTLSARYYKDGSEILIPQPGKNPRRLTPRECARLMGFPDDFKIVVSDTQAYKQFGNSVAVPVVSEVARSLKDALYARSEQKSNRTANPRTGRTELSGKSA